MQKEGLWFNAHHNTLFKTVCHIPWTCLEGTVEATHSSKNLLLFSYRALPHYKQAHYNNQTTIRTRICKPVCLQQLTQTTFMWWSRVMQDYASSSFGSGSRGSVLSPATVPPHGCLLHLCLLLCTTEVSLLPRAFLHCTECLLSVRANLRQWHHKCEW